MSLFMELLDLALPVRPGADDALLLLWHYAGNALWTFAAAGATRRADERTGPPVRRRIASRADLLFVPFTTLIAAAGWIFSGGAHRHAAADLTGLRFTPSPGWCWHCSRRRSCARSIGARCATNSLPVGTLLAGGMVLWTGLSHSSHLAKSFISSMGIVMVPVFSHACSSATDRRRAPGSVLLLCAR